MQHSRRSPSADFSHLSKGIHKRPARQHHQDHNDHSHTDPEPAARLAHIPHVPDQYTAIFCCVCNRGKSRRHHRGHSLQVDHLSSQVCLVVLSRSGSNLKPRLLRTAAAATTIAHPSDARVLRHISWPLPVQRTRPSHTPH